MAPAHPGSEGRDGELPVLEARSVTKRFPGVLALDDVSFALGAGEVHALVGENGAGKSTLIKTITGVYAPDEGEILLGDAPVSFAGPRAAGAAGVSTIFQEVNLVPLMSVAQNLFLGREPRNRLGLVDHSRMRRDADELLRRYGLDVDVGLPLRTLGVGVQQMVAVVRAVSVDARVVIMDEPTSSLEAREVDTLFETIAILREAGVGIVYVSHRLEELFTICDSITVLRDGRLVHTGPMSAMTRVGLVSTMLGRDQQDVRRHGATSFSDHRGGGDDAEVVLEAEDLRHRPELRGVSLTVREGEVVGLAGLLGAGRSETAKAIAGALPLDGGTVEIGGLKIRTGSPRAAIGAGVALIPEDRKSEGILPGLSIRENIALAALPRISRAGIVSDSRRDALVDTFMERLQIKAASPDQLVGELSGGNQQKVLLARWLCMSPKVLILDEPTRGIDVGAKAEVQGLVDELAERGLGVILISSELEEVLEGSDSVVVLREGSVADVMRGDEVGEERLMGALAGEEPGRSPGVQASRDGEQSTQNAGPEAPRR